MVITVSEPGQLLAALDDSPPIRDDPHEAGLERVELAGFASVKGDVLRILAQTDHAETKISLVPLLIEIEPDQRVANPSGKHRAGNGIDQRRENHVARDIDRCTAAEWDSQSSGQGPQDRQKRDEGDEGTQQTERQGKADRGEPVEIVRNPLIRVVGRRLVQLHPVIGLVFEPVAQEALRQPAPPADMQYSPQIRGIDANYNKCQREPSEDRKLPPELRPIVLLKCVIEIIVPIIEPNIEPNSDQVERDDGGEQPNCRPFLIRLPVWPGKVPGLTQKSLPSRHRHYFAPLDLALSDNTTYDPGSSCPPPL